MPTLHSSLDARRPPLGHATESVKPLRIALLDDHPIVLDGVAAWLEHEPGFVIEHRSTSSGPTLAELARGRIDALVLDFYLAPDDTDGVALVRFIRRRYPDLAIIVLSAGQTRETAYTAYQAGASAFISKWDAARCVAHAVRQSVTRAGQFHHTHTGVLVFGAPLAPEHDLSLNEIEVLHRLAAGASVSQISSNKSRSRKTISSHKRNAMRKLGLTSDLALAQYLNLHYGFLKK